MTDNAMFEAFMTLHRGLPRQGPGSDATTRHLFTLAGPLPRRPRVLDLGCGPGRASLRDWRRLIAPGGALVVTECEWTVREPSAGARAFWDRHYALRGRPQNTAAAVAAGYDVLGVYGQPESDWDEYYVPLGARADAADPAAPGMDEVLPATRAEIAVRARHGTEYGYTGYVLRPAAVSS